MELSHAATPRPEPRFASDREAAQREAFLRDGFVVVPGLFDEEEIARISAGRTSSSAARTSRVEP